MKLINVISLIVVCFIATSLQAQESIHEFKTQTIDGEVFDLASLKGKKVLVVNTASKCGLTGQYKELQALYEAYKENDFTIIAFPANNFLNQEPGTNEDIKGFCELNYGVTFPLMSKISVKGKDIDPIFDWLTDKDKNGVSGSAVSWNFQKFLIDANGKLVDVLSPRESPMSDKIISWIETGN